MLNHSKVVCLCDFCCSAFDSIPSLGRCWVFCLGLESFFWNDLIRLVRLFYWGVGEGIFWAYIGPEKLRPSFALAPLNLRFYERRLGGGERGFCGAVLWVERIEWVEWGFRHAIPFRLQLQAGRMSRMRSFGSLPCLNGTSSMLELFFICQKKFVSLQNRI